MCNAALIQGGLKIGGQIGTYFAQRSAAKQQWRYAQRRYKLASEQALESMEDRYAAVRTQQAQRHEQHAQELQEITGRAEKAIGTSAVSAAAAGVSGFSVASILHDFVRKEAKQVGLVRRQQRAEDAAAEFSLKGIQMQTYGRLLAAMPQPVAFPNFALTILQAGGTGAQAYQSYQASKAK